MKFALLGNVVLEHGIVEDGAVVVRDGLIEYAGEKRQCVLPDTVHDVGDAFIAPGFVDIHNHLLDRDAENMEKILEAADYHLNDGTTSLLFSLYRDIPVDTMLHIMANTKKEMPDHPQILGFHLEGPYLNPKHGATGMCMLSTTPNPEEYRKLIDTGLVRQWTFAPENEGIDQFLNEIVSAGIVPAVGHTQASAARFYEVVDKGVKIVTHMFDALGADETEKKKNVELFDITHAAMLSDDVYYEVICDGEEAHVAYPLIHLLVKASGIDKLVAITDSIALPVDEKDAVYIDGELNGSCMTMRRAAKNLLKAGFGVLDIFRATTANPARAIGAEREVGCLQKDCRGNIQVTDAEFNLTELYLDGKRIR